MMSKPEKIKTAIVGYGFRGKGVVKNILANGNYRIVAGAGYFSSSE